MSVVLVGIDGSAVAAIALRWAADYARRARASLRVLHVWEMPPGLRGADRIAPPLRRDLQQVAADILADGVAAARAVAGDGVDVDGEVRQGSIRPELMAAAKKADLLVVGSVGHGRLSGMLVGSVAEYCIRHASCPVAVVPLPAADRKSAA